jgi:hypothetical protein
MHRFMSTRGWSGPVFAAGAPGSLRASGMTANAAPPLARFRTHDGRVGRAGQVLLPTRCNRFSAGWLPGRYG